MMGMSNFAMGLPPEQPRMAHAEKQIKAKPRRTNKQGFLLPVSKETFKQNRRKQLKLRAKKKAKK